MPFRLAVDIGGTFTDAVLFDEESGQIKLAKVPSTPDDYSRGVIDSVQTAGASFDSISMFAHGTTVCLNAIVQGRLPKVTLVTTKGFRDIIEINRGIKLNMYDPLYRPSPPLVPRWCRFEISERMGADGVCIDHPKLSEIRKTGKIIGELGIRQLAVCLIDSYRNDEHEIIIRDALLKQNKNLQITISSDLTKEYQEYERFTTAVLNAALVPIMTTYLDALRANMARLGFEGNLYIMQSNGGTSKAETIRNKPVFTINSGVAGGIIGVRALSTLIGRDNMLGGDMGGTSFDVEVVKNGEFERRSSMVVQTPLSGEEGYPILFPVIDIHVIGAGGGSIAWVDEVDALHVGPQSAAGVPGPACYGRGGQEPTITDANLLLGRLNPKYFLGGKMDIDPELSREAVQKISTRLHMDIIELAAGVLRIAVHNMAGAVFTMTVRRGIDPKEFSMVSFGGAGPLHGVLIAREIGIPEVIVPNMPGNFSAWGMLMTDLRHDYVQTEVELLKEMQLKKLNDTFQKIESAARDTLHREGVTDKQITFLRSLDIRYLGQGHALTVNVPSGQLTASEIVELERRFDDSHLKTYLHNAPEEAKEVVAIRVSAIGQLKPATLRKIDRGSEDSSAAQKSSRKVFFEQDFDEYQVYEREKLRARNRIEGPALIEEVASTTFLPPGATLVVDQFGNLVINVGK